MEDNKYLIALSHFPKFGPIRLKKIKKYFSDLATAFKSSFNELIKAGLEDSVAEEFIAFRESLNPDVIMANLEREKIKTISIDDKAYPKLLQELYSPPQLLYYKGDINLNDDFPLAVVGTRKYSSYGQQVAESIVKHLVKNNLSIVSGLALGIDTLSHLACLEAGGKTVAVLGSGLDKQNIYPVQNKYLVDKIILSGGVVISEFPPGTPPLKHNFPQRNRIISGLSLGTLVIEAGEKSGALITAWHSLDQNREVFAVPGNIYSNNSTGPNRLIKMGAKVITSAEDIIETLNLAQATSFIDNQKIIPESKEEEIIMSVLSHDPIHIDEVVRLTRLDTSVANSTLTIMEMKGMVKNLGSMQYVLAR